MAERPEDLNLPLAVVSRIIKESIPDDINVSKEARQAISKAASVFVLYATSCANNFALKGKRKTLAANDIFQAMGEMEFERFVPELKKSWEAFTAEKQAKLEKKKQQKESKENQDLEKDGEVVVEKDGDVVEKDGQVVVENDNEVNVEKTSEDSSKDATMAVEDEPTTTTTTTATQKEDGEKDDATVNGEDPASEES